MKIKLILLFATLTYIEREHNSKDRITKARRFSQETTKELRSSKEVNGNGKKSHEEAVQQEKEKPIRIKGRRQCVARSQEYPFKLTLKKTGSEKIQIF